jgi:hypothetical protein
VGGRKDGRVEVYGKLYPKGVLRFAIELDCYRTNHPPSLGGLGAEQHFRNAWKILWPSFEHNSWTDAIISAWCNYRYIVIIGHQRASKTYTTAFCAYLDYFADPENTLTSVSTVTFEGLRLRMWSDLLRAAETEALKDPFTIRSTTNECRLFPTEFAHEASEKYQIHGMSISRTSDAAGRIRGGHAPRRRIILDEAQDMPTAIFDSLVNPMSAPDAKAVFLSNPVEKVSEFGRWCEPEGGWASVNDMDLSWHTKKGGICLRLDGLQSPNIRAGRTLYPYMLTQQSIDEIVAAHGKDSVQYYSLVRGLFPPDGMVSRVFPSSVIEKGRPAIAFDFEPQMCATLDPAWEADDCVLHFGQLAMPVFGERQYKISGTETMVFKFDASSGAEIKDYQILNWIMAECRKRGVLPKHFIMDKTGGGRGLYAMLQKNWGMEVNGIEYGGAATDRKLRGDDNRIASDLYLRFISEAWFRASEFMRAGFIGGLDKLDPRTIEDLYARRYELKQDTKGHKQVVETKPELKKRLGRSPDFGDSFVGFGELLIRLGTLAGGGIAARLAAKSPWDRQRERVLRINSRQSEAMEHAY